MLLTNADLSTPAHLASLDILAALGADTSINPHFSAACRREVARAKIQAERNAGLNPDFGAADPIAVRSVEAVKAEAEAFEARLNSPRGRFLAAIHELESHGWEEATTARGIYCRHLADDRLPVDHDALLRAIRLMSSINHSLARQAVLALTEIGAPLLQEAA